MRSSTLAVVAAASAALVGALVVEAQQFENNGNRGQGEYRQGQAPRQGEFERSGQNQNQTPYRSGFRGQNQPGASTFADWQIVEWIDVDNENEIALAEIAEQKAKDDDVKEFARKMVDEHTDFLHKLNRAIRGPRNNQSSQQNRQYTQARGQQGLDLVALKHQLGEQCRQSASQELKQKSGEEFDKCYIGMQLGMHMQMLDTLKVMSRYASPDLDRIIEQGEESTQAHLDRAKEIMRSLEGQRDTSARSARRPSRD